LKALGRTLATGDLRQSRSGQLRALAGNEIVGALAACNELGSSLVRLFDAKDFLSYPACVKLLVADVGARHTVEVPVREIVKLAIYEAIHRLCTTCGGLGWCTDFDGVRRSCFSCDASGQRRFTNGERARFVQRKNWTRGFDSALTDAANLIDSAYRQCRSVVSSELSEKERA
jgi:hypothetical protein